MGLHHAHQKELTHLTRNLPPLCTQFFVIEVLAMNQTMPTKATLWRPDTWTNCLPMVLFARHLKTKSLTLPWQSWPMSARTVLNGATGAVLICIVFVIGMKTLLPWMMVVRIIVRIFKPLQLRHHWHLKTLLPLMMVVRIIARIFKPLQLRHQCRNENQSGSKFPKFLCQCHQLGTHKKAKNNQCPSPEANTALWVSNWKKLYIQTWKTFDNFWGLFLKLRQPMGLQCLEKMNVELWLLTLCLFWIAKLQCLWMQCLKHKWVIRFRMEIRGNSRRRWVEARPDAPRHAQTHTPSHAQHRTKTKTQTQHGTKSKNTNTTENQNKNTNTTGCVWQMACLPFANCSGSVFL